LGVYHTGKTHDAGATTTAAVYEQLGRPSYIAPFFTGNQTVYRRVIDPVVTYNVSVAYRFSAGSNSWLRGTRLRLGVINLTDQAPPLESSENFGYNPSVSQNLLAGRTWTLDFSRTF
jgi:iron complex outermembrane receptor protein